VNGLSWQIDHFQISSIYSIFKDASAIAKVRA
jgi:hypothetical protein